MKYYKENLWERKFPSGTEFLYLGIRLKVKQSIYYDGLFCSMECDYVDNLGVLRQFEVYAGQAEYIFNGIT